MLDFKVHDKPDYTGLSVLLYGLPKVGKTSEAAKVPNVALIGCEPKGLAFITGVPKASIGSLSELEGAALGKIQELPQTAIVLDGLTWLINQECVLEASKTGANGYAVNGQAAYGAITKRVTLIISALLDSNKIVIATGHHRVINLEDGTTVTGEQAARGAKRLAIRPDVNEAMADELFGLFAITGYCFVKPGSSQSTVLTKPDDNGKRLIHAGDRTGMLPKEMPLSMVDILAKVKGPK